MATTKGSKGGDKGGDKGGKSSKGAKPATGKPAAPKGGKKGK